MQTFDLIHGKDASYLGKSRATLTDWILGFLSVAGIAFLCWLILAAFS